MRDNRARQVAFLRIIDGDTFAARALDLWPGTKPKLQAEAHIRVKDWNADELSQAEGPLMRDQFGALLAAAARVDVVSQRMSFERVVCAVYLDDVLFAGLLTRALLTLRRTLAQSTAKGRMR